MSNNINLREIISDSIFCYAKPGGQGFVKKSECQCYREGKLCCDAYLERNEFYRLYDELQKRGFSRAEILAEVRRRYNWDETSWIRHNVKN